MLPYKYIAIEGNIGAGKSTLARFLHKHLGGSMLLEEFEENESLKAFYSNPSFALNAELQFMLDRSHQLHAFHQKSHDLIVSDYTPLKSLIFARSNLKKKDFLLYEPIAKQMLQVYPQPDLIIYLDRPLEELLNNIKNRGRDYEQNLKTAYLSNVSEGYESYLFPLYNVPVLKIQASEINLNKPDLLASSFLRILQTTYAPQVRSVDLKSIMNVSVSE